MGLEVYKLHLPDSSARWSPLRFCKKEILAGNWNVGERKRQWQPLLSSGSGGDCRLQSQPSADQPEYGLWVPAQRVSSFSSLNAASSSYWFLYLYSLSFALP